MLQLFINKKTRLVIALLIILGLAACHNKRCTKQTDKQVSWREDFPAQLSLLGHRNWILVVDKAFPLQTASGTEVINTNEDLLPVLKEVLQDISASTHLHACKMIKNSTALAKFLINHQHKQKKLKP